MSMWRNIRSGLRAFGQSAMSRGLGHSAAKAVRILRHEGPAAIAKRLRALTPLPSARRGGDAGACLIVTTPHVEWIARMMARRLARHGLRAEVAGDAKGANAFGHVFVLTPQMFADLPDDFIAFQMEQHVSGRWMTPDYLALLGRARAVLDYSRDNIARLAASGVPLARLFHVPLSPDPAITPPAAARDGVLFVGDISAPRRAALLKTLKSAFPTLSVEVALFGEGLARALDRAQVVLNLHFYDNALLETARIHQARSHGAWVVSETASDQSLHGELPGVIFAPAGDADGLITAIRQALAAGPPPPATATPGADFGAWFDRALLGLGIIRLADFQTANPGWPGPIASPPRLCLSLAETPDRRLAFDDSGARDFQIWQGLRASPGWRGAATSYCQMFSRLLAEGHDRAIICEDDVLFAADFDRRLQAVENHLATRQDWDMFSGFIADLSPDTQVLDVVEAGDETFVTLDRAVSMVMNIYRRPVMEWLAGWDETDMNAFTNTIDRRLEARPFRIITTVPFLVGHRDDAESTLREFGNAKYQAEIAATESLLRDKIARWRNSAQKA